MAIVTKHLTTINNEITVTYDYDDVSLIIQTVDVVNTSARDYTVKVTRLNNGQEYEFTIGPGELHQNIPQGAATRLGLSINANGRLDGVEWSIS